MTKKNTLFDLCDPFARVAGIVEPFQYPDDMPLRDVLPGIWPTVGDVRKLREEMVKLGWSNDHRRAG